jgi:hypothetical protein
MAAEKIIVAADGIDERRLTQQIPKEDACKTAWSAARQDNNLLYWSSFGWKASTLSRKPCAICLMNIGYISSAVWKRIDRLYSTLSLNNGCRELLWLATFHIMLCPAISRRQMY